MAVSRQPLWLVPSESFGSLLKRQRRMGGLTQKQLGERFGVQQQTIAAWEHDKRPESRHFGELAKYLEMNEKDLVTLIDSQPTIPIDLARAAETAKQPAAVMMQLLAKSFVESDRKGKLSPEAAETYGKFADYFKSAELGHESSR